MDPATLGVLLVSFVATLIRSAFGFGEALIAVPLLAVFLPVTVAAPVAVLLSITIATVVVVQDWEKIHLRSTGWLVGFTLLGIPLGLLLLTRVHQDAVKTVLGVLLLAFSGYALFGGAPPKLHRDSRRWLAGCGFCAGVLGGAYGFNGPPLIIYGTMRQWTPQHFRATLQGYFLPASLLGMTGYYFAGLWLPMVTHFYLISLPVVLPTIFLGRWLNHRMRGDTFLHYIHVGLICIGLTLLAQLVMYR